MDKHEYAIAIIEDYIERYGRKSCNPIPMTPKQQEELELSIKFLKGDLNEPSR